MTDPIKVLIIDDSLTSRVVIRSALSRDPRFQVVGVATDPATARAMIIRLRPDVLTLDIEMPHMSGLQFLEKIMRLRPMPVVMISAHTTHGADATIQAMQMGAVECLAKPTAGNGWPELKTLPDLIANAASARIMRPLSVPLVKTTAFQRPVAAPANTLKPVMIGASTGGIEALTEILGAMPALCPPILITQHIGAAFTGSLARRLDQQCPPSVIVATDGLPIKAGCVYIAPGGETHLELGRVNGSLICQLSAGPPQCGHRPSVDALFFSAAEICGHNAIGVILTGMGEDGARGLLAMRQKGAHTIGQNRRTSVVYGMPGAAMAMSAVEKERPIDQIALSILEISNPHTQDQTICA